MAALDRLLSRDDPLARVGGGSPDEVIAQVEQAVERCLSLAGRPDEGIPTIQEAMDASPEDPAPSQYRYFMALAHFNAERYEEAARWARESIALNSCRAYARRVFRRRPFLDPTKTGFLHDYLSCH